nr:coiled-coil domain-containing protein 154 [Ciona intestinalis]|eukprot:XP_002123709.1 coiled-coil domain-containing protein 154 [Ciona intestinalis]
MSLTKLPGRHRLAVLPGLAPSRSASLAGNDITTTLATLDDESSNKQLVPIPSYPNSKHNVRQLPAWNGTTSLRSRESDESIGGHIQNVVTRITMLEEGNKAILEEVYRLQSNARAADYSRKEVQKEEKKVQRELMETMRSSNDVISQLTSRLRRAEEKLHHERENLQNITSHSKKLEQALFNSQKETDSQRETQTSQMTDLRHRLEDITRKLEKGDRTSENIVDEFHQLKNKLDTQAMEFSHMQNEMKQRSKRTEDEIKQTLQQARLQKDNNNMAEQNTLQLRHLFESRMAETRDAVVELRNRVAHAESDARSQVQQVSLKVSELQSNLGDLSHKRLEELQSLEKTRQEQSHSEENERLKLHKKIQVVVEEMSEKLLQKESRLREEALRKFVDVEKLMQREESSRVDFERQMREDTENRWNLQQKIYNEEMQSMKEMRRTERTRHSTNYKKIDEMFKTLDRKINNDRKSVEKVLLAEITKREEQATRQGGHIDGVQEQLRIAVSTLQQAIGGLQFQAAKDKDRVLGEIKSRMEDGESKLNRALTDTDARLTALSIRLTQQEETLDSKMSEFKSTVREQHNEMMHSATEWREVMNKDIVSMQDVLKSVPQELKETQERVELLKADVETKTTLEAESRFKDAESTKKQLRNMSQHFEDIDSSMIEGKLKFDQMQRDVTLAQRTVSQMERLLNDARSNLTVRVNSETKMRMEETSGIKQELARLKMDIQPLLWKKKSDDRTFVKRPLSTLNEWGLYQCARWYDIKMRWLQLLDKSRHRNFPPRSKEFFPVRDPPKSASPVSLGPDARAGIPDADLDQTDYSGEDTELENLVERNDTPSQLASSRATSADVLDANDVIGDVGDDVVEGNMPPDGAINPQPAWYNQENVGEKKTNASRASNKSGGQSSPKVTKQSTPQPTPGNQSPPGSKRSPLQRDSGGSRASRASQRKSNEAAAPSTGGQPKRQQSQVQPGGGTSYDMEGRRN